MADKCSTCKGEILPPNIYDLKKGKVICGKCYRGYKLQEKDLVLCMIEILQRLEELEAEVFKE